MRVLPLSATPASLRRAQLAVTLAQACPPSLADEIALVGSTAHGFADDVSDLELNLWASVIPPLDERLNWLRSSGATDTHAEAAPRPDESYWIGFRIGGVPAEVGWQSFEAAQRQLERILSGTVTDRKTLTFADVLASAIPLRSEGKLAAWQTALADYPPALQAALIHAALERWSRPDAFASALRLARRGEVLALGETLLPEIDAALRAVYAAQRRWEPSRKWTLTVLREFAPQTAAQVDAVFSEPLPQRRVELCARLCLSVLALVPPADDVAAAQTALGAFLRGG